MPGPQPGLHTPSQSPGHPCPSLTANHGKNRVFQNSVPVLGADMGALSDRCTFKHQHYHLLALGKTIRPVRPFSQFHELGRITVIFQSCWAEDVYKTIHFAQLSGSSLNILYRAKSIIMKPLNWVLYTLLTQATTFISLSMYNIHFHPNC